MNSNELKLIVQNDKVLNRHFLGVFPRDKLPFINQKGMQIFIVNCSKSGTPGTHWVLMCYNGRRHVLYYDPFGFPDYYYGKEFKIHMDEFARKSQNNNVAHQDFRSDKCGFFCLFIAIKLVRNWKFNKISRLFYRKKLSRNDNILERFFRAKF